jgi:K+-sensing histidine kinase KdpD
VENAVKYAVSPQEEGARISLTARVVGQRLRITVEDTGPGVDGPVQISMLDRAGSVQGRPVSTGVGLANIRNRLMQGYGDDHLFETRSQPGGGFTVLIEIPYETDEEVAPEARQAPVQTTPAQTPPITQPDALPPTAAPSGNVINLNPQRAIGNTP